ncbi:hypothetical protein ACO0QE_004488 [Hanseniaspora vineae]
MSDSQYEAALRLFKRLDPSKIPENLISLISLEPALSDDLLNDIDQPLKVKSAAKGKDFLCCDYNRDADNYRSPWDNTYYNAEGTALTETESDEEMYYPNDELRLYEKLFNDSFEVYKDLYYEQGSYSSCYLWETEESLKEGFAGCVLFKKTLATGDGGNWDSIHVFEVLQNTESDTTAYEYRITSTIILDLQQKISSTSKIGGNLQRQAEKTVSLDVGDGFEFNNSHSDAFHLINLGKLVEDMENKLRTMLEQVYFDKTINIYRNLVKESSLPGSDHSYQKDLQENIAKGIANI